MENLYNAFLGLVAGLIIAFVLFGPMFAGWV